MNKLNKSCMINLRNILYDIVGNSLAYLVCYYVFAVFLQETNIMWVNTLIAGGVYLFIYLLLGLSGRMYDLSTFYYRDRVIKRVLSGCITATALVTFVFYFSGRGYSNRGFYGMYFILCLAAHTIAAFASYRRNKIHNADKKTLFIGTKSDFETFNGYIKKTNLSFDTIGYIKLEKDGTEQPGEYLGYADQGDLDHIIRERIVDQVYIMREQGKGELIHKCIDSCVKFGAVTRLVLPLAREDCSTHIGCIGTYPVVSYHLNCLNPFMHFVKRIIDIIGASVGIVFSAPLMLASAIAIKLDSAGPVLFKQIRVGQNGRRFKIFKLRTMTANAELHKQELLALNEVGGGFMFKMREDPRITRVGAFLRKTSFDEFPQFFNVLVGDMSLVGTRPPTEDEVERYECKHWRRLRIKPGITGLWQISGRSAINDFDEIVKLDTEYMKTWSILSDIKILFYTLAVVVRRKGAY